jgi:hypothetical protein
MGYYLLTQELPIAIAPPPLNKLLWRIYVGKCKKSRKEKEKEKRKKKNNTRMKYYLWEQLNGQIRYRIGERDGCAGGWWL